MAEAASVSIATASYVLSGRRGSTTTGVADATAERVRQAAMELGYLPNQAARAVRTGRTQIVLLSMTMLADPWTQSVIDVVRDASEMAGRLALVMSDTDWTTTLDRVEADVAFIDCVRPTQVPRLRELARQMRIVVFSETLEPDGFDVIRSEDLPGCQLAVEHLVAGHRRIGCLTSVDATGRRHRRHQAWAKATADAGLAHDDSLVAEFAGRSAQAYAAATDLLSRPGRPTALFATTDFAAMAAVDAAQRIGLRVPDDLAVIGVGNSRQTELVSPSISSVGPRNLFPALANLLMRRADGDRGPSELHEFVWELTARESTAGTITPSAPLDAGYSIREFCLATDRRDVRRVMRSG